MRAPVTSMASAPSVTVSWVVSLTDIGIFVGLSSATVHKCQYACNEEKDAVHDTKCERSFQHRALLICWEVQSIDICAPEDTEVDLVAISACNVRAVLMRYASKVIDSSDKSTDETQIDERDEARIGGRSMVGKECADCPSDTEHGNDEEDQDVGRCKGIGRSVDVYKVG